jgi:hypothetical protein
MLIPFLRRIFAPAILAASLPLAPCAQSAIPEGWFVWPSVEPAAGSALDTSALNPAPAGASGRITTKDGAFVTKDGRPIRFFGVNLASDDAFPSAADAELLARRLAKAGVNIARLHHLDNPWSVQGGGSLWSKDNPRRQIPDPAQLDKVHRLIATLAAHGIYSNLNLKVSKSLSAADGLPDSVSQLPDYQKRVDLFDRRMIELQKDYARRLLTTKNPYTGYAPADDPAVAIVEINNENSLLGYFTRDLGRGAERFPEPFRSELQAQWNSWLSQRYASTAALAAAWAGSASSTAAPQSILPASASWEAKIQPGTKATLTPGTDSSSFTVAVEKTAGLNWHVQVTTGALRVEDNAVYTIAFEVRARTAGKISVGLCNDTATRPGEEWRSFGLLQPLDVTTGWTPVRLVFPVHSVATSLARINFDVAERVNRIEIRALRFSSGAAEGGLRPGQSLEAQDVPLPVEPTTRQWADWIAFLAATDRAFAEEMRSYLRDVLQVKAPIICSQINFTGLPAIDREQSMDFADTHVYWEHPLFPGAGFDRSNWTVANSPQLAVFGPRRFGELGNLAYLRIAGKPFSVSEYDHPAASDFVCEMYPELSVFACRQNWDAVYAFDIGTYGTRNTEGRISGFFDQINHPAKWSLAPFATRVFRSGLIPPAATVATLRPGRPVWSEAMHADMLWAKLNPDQPFDFLDCRLQISDRPSSATATLVRTGKPDDAPARVIEAPQGRILVAATDRAAVATGYLGGTDVVAGALHVACPRFGRDFATVAAVSLDGKPFADSARILVTIVARAENTGMKWNALRNSVGADWGHGPTIAERVPATITLAAGARKVFALAPDGTRAREVKITADAGALSFTVSPEDHTLHYEIVAE